MLTDGFLLPLFTQRDFSSDTRVRMDHLTQELATGRQFDTGRALSSDFSSYSRVAHELRTIDARQDALSRASIWTDIAQGSLGAIDAIGKGLADGLTVALSSPDPRAIANLGGSGQSALADIAAILGTSDAGRAIFANGDATGTPPYDIAVLRAETSLLAQTAPDIATMLQAFDDYFAPGGAIEISALSPYPAQPVKFPLGEGAAVDVPVEAGDPAIRDALKQAALIAALPDAGFLISADDRQALALELPRRSVAAGSELAAMRGGLGSVEARLNLLSERLTDDRTRLEARRTDAVGTDPFDVANRLQNEMSRLETIYAVTARRSQLKLTDYLR
ncbi:flagellin [Jannaschia donghaensis]|uniref:Flagellar hook-associated protein FlgL n=1 Tax=Jannaschia donghaensis TaxID=420998 RepID=A0A0M6YIU6_9RHOB|nr:flagellin [Jannaschia donghaensis]CTQ49699.1 flagellar hook-associated protein FlgL [Jannaschia donghaensis]